MGEILSAEDVSTKQKDILRIATLAKLVVLSIEYTQELNHRATDITYGIVAIIKKTQNYKNDQSAINIYYQTLRELREIKEADVASEIASVIRSSKGASTLDHT